MKIEEVQIRCNQLIDEVEKAIVGKRHVLEKVTLAILSDGHILLEDFPGLAKTMMAKSFAMALGCGFKRVQFTPDLLPADITGTYVFNQSSGEFSLRKGPLFTNILLADEINRAPPRTQAALLEAMQERQATLEGETYLLERPFIVMATQNPIEYEGTYPLPEAQIDRFLMRIGIGYPDRGQEKEILDRRKARKKDEVDIERIAGPRTVLEMQRAIEEVHTDDDIEEYIVDIVRRTRNDLQVEVGSSPRGTLSLFKLSKARAALHGRDFVIPDDVKDVAVAGLAHRLILKPDPWVRGVKTESIVEKILREIPVPKVD